MALATGDYRQKNCSVLSAGAVLITFPHFRLRMRIPARRLLVGQECPTCLLGSDQAQFPDVRLYDSCRASSAVIDGN